MGEDREQNSSSELHGERPLANHFPFIGSIFLSRARSGGQYCHAGTCRYGHELLTSNPGESIVPTCENAHDDAWTRVRTR